MSRVALVVNANARRFVEDLGLVDEVKALAGTRATVHVTRTRAELDAVAKELAEGAVETVVLCGGDGSYAAGATALHRAAVAFGAEMPILALAAGGTVGTVARSLELTPHVPLLSKHRTRDQIGAVLEAACATRPKLLERRALSVRADDHPESLGFIFGTGLVASFFALYDPRAAASEAGDELEGPSQGTGLIGAASIVARVFVQSFYGGALARQVLSPLRCDVAVEDENGREVRLPWRASSLVAASILEDLGLGMRVTPRATEDESRVHAVVSGLTPRALGPRMVRVLRGAPISDAPFSLDAHTDPRPGGRDGEPPERLGREAHFDGLVKTLIVRFPDGRGPYVLDGDLRAARRIAISRGDRLRILAPGAFAS